ncbi:MAG: FecR domain-containing protein, partial [Spirochaetaceae bacterium]|nr:FecR domain-containing protein [Spirochaetaceae bacterium]
QDGETTRTAVSLQTGRVRATRPPVTRSTRRSIDFRVSTPVATAAVRGTDFFLSPDKLQTVEGLVALSIGQAVILSPGGTWSWAPEGLRPMDPTELVGVRWSVSPSAGSMPGDGRGSGGKSTSSKRAYARITLQ